MPINLKDLQKITNVNTIVKNEQTGNYTVQNTDPDAIEGILDILLKTATLHLDAQFSSGRIRAENYASAFVQIYQATLTNAINIFLQKDLIDNQILSEQEKTKLYKRQIIGFDDQKALQTTQTLLDTYNVFLSTSPAVDNQPFPNIFVEYFKRNTNNPINGTSNSVKCMSQLDTMISNLINRANTITDVTQENGGITIIPDIPQTGTQS